jgi:hypothetical protein
MRRRWLTAILVPLALAAPAAAQTAGGPFRWQTGQVLTYRVEQVTSATDTAGDTKATSTTRVNSLKQWRVLAVDAAGVATLQLSLAALRFETTTPGGDVLLFDSASPDKSNPQMREQMAKYVGPALAVLRIDGRGQVVGVNESNFGPASRYESELPFVLTLPAEGLRAGQTWQRAYRVTLEPPQGTGEKYDAVQQYVCKSAEGGSAVVGLTTTLVKLPEALADQVPLLQVQPEGDVVFDTQNGLLRSARLKIDKELKGHQGENSSYRFQSNYTEEFVPNR